MKRLLFVTLLTILGCCGVRAQAIGYEKIINPVLPGDRPDPTVIEINGEYWAAATSNELSYDEKQDKVYLYYTARDKRSNRLSCAAAVADSPMGKFKDLGPLVAQ